MSAMRNNFGGLIDEECWSTEQLIFGIMPGAEEVRWIGSENSGSEDSVC